MAKGCFAFQRVLFVTKQQDDLRMKVSTRLSAVRSESRRKKTVHLLRHGQTEMNVFLAEHEPDFEDPLMYALDPQQDCLTLKSTFQQNFGCTE